MFDPKRLLDQFLGGQGGGALPDGRQGGGGGVFNRVGDYARQNPGLTGVAAGGLAGLILGKGFGGDIVKYGGMAVLGGLAYKAYRDYQQSQQQQVPYAPGGHYDAADFRPAPADSPFAPANAPLQLPETLIVAMIAAAKADGHIDAEERGRIYQRLEEGGLQPEEVAFLQHELTEPVDMDRIVSGAVNKEAAVEIYAASVMAIRKDTPQEQAYLDALAERLKLEPGLVQSIENTVAALAR
ncbi:MAG: tellurite resistance TerB family protein [Rhizobiales bacterium]|nr:tellurite resistance TerB family protein [Hyphomicrobiales bacterium]